MLSSPSFYLTGRQPLRPGVILLAVLAALGALGSLVYAMDQVRHVRMGSQGADSARSAGSGSAGSGDADDKDDPNQIDTIVLGDPADAPVPAKHGNHVSPVHPTIVVRLPRWGKDTGMVPDSPAGHLLVDWLGAFNHTSGSGLAAALPSAGTGAATTAQLLLRERTGGFNLLSAREVEPGVLVFRLRDQTAAAGEVLGTLQMVPGSNPAAIASFSLRGVGSE